VVGRQPGKFNGREKSVRAKIWLSVLVIFCGSICVTAAAQDQSQQELRSLDDQVQEIKTDVLSIARDLALLEERLLFPSNTQLSVFVEMGEETDFRLDAVRVEIDGDAVAHHIYSFKELEALQGGGVQRIYTGNLTTGAHNLTIAVNGKRPNGDEFTSSESFSFSKDIDPKIIGLTLADQSGGASISLGNW
jgi:hypothetical protein